MARHEIPGEPAREETCVGAANYRLETLRELGGDARLHSRPLIR